MGNCNFKRWCLVSVQIVFCLLVAMVLTSTSWAQAPGLGAVAVHDDIQSDPGSVKIASSAEVPSSAGGVTLLGYRITFGGVTYNSNGTSTWRYTVAPYDSPPKALSHWTLGLCIPTYGVVSASPGGYEVGTDPTTGVTGIKWETQIEPDDLPQSFSVTISGWYQVASVDVAAKAGQNVAPGLIDGPSCDPVEPTPTPTNTPVTPTPTSTPVTPTPTNTPVTPTPTPTNTPTPDIPVRHIYGYVYLDGTSEGLADAIVELKVRWNGVWSSAGTYTTAADGFFEFFYEGPIGAFTLTETNPLGYRSTSASEPYPVVEVLGVDDFRHETPPWEDLGPYIFYDTLESSEDLGSIGDYVWHDEDWDGVQDGQELRLAHIGVTLKDAAGKIVGFGETDERGWYIFTLLEQGLYTAVVDANDQDLPHGFVPTTPTSVEVSLGRGEHFLDADFGFAAACPVCPDWLIFHTDRDGNWELYTMGSEEGAEELNLTNDPATDIGPSRAPDARWVAFQSDRNGNWDIFAVSVDGLQTVQLTSDPADDIDANWSSECGISRIAFQSNRDGNWEIYIVNMDGSGERRVTVNDAADTDPAWSPEPDSGKIAFQSDRDGNWDIYVVDVATGEETRVVDHPGDDVDPSWSPDGRYIAFLSNRDGNWEVYVLDVQLGTEIRLTTSGGEERNAAWSPDGNWLAYQSDRDGNWEVYVSSADGAQEIRVTTNLAVDLAPTWDCGSSTIAFHSERDGNPELYLVSPFTGDEAFRLTENAAKDMYPAWMPPEEDGTLMMKTLFSSDPNPARPIFGLQ